MVVSNETFHSLVSDFKGFYENYPYGMYGCLIFCVLYLIKLCFNKQTVNCWFCNANTIVNFSQRNSWICPKCEQYNGFNKNGDYNMRIEAMYENDVKENSSKAVPGSADCNDFPHKAEVRLCKVCNRNQLLKIKQISKFEPVASSNYDAEFKDFKDKLEDLYALCKTCDRARAWHVKTQDTMIRGNLKTRGYLRTVVLDKVDDLIQKKSSFNSFKRLMRLHLKMLPVMYFASTTFLELTNKGFLDRLSAWNINLPSYANEGYLKQTISVSIVVGAFTSLLSALFGFGRTGKYGCLKFWLISAVFSFLKDHTVWSANLKFIEMIKAAAYIKRFITKPVFWILDYKGFMTYGKLLCDLYVKISLVVKSFREYSEEVEVPSLENKLLTPRKTFLHKQSRASSNVEAYSDNEEESSKSDSEQFHHSTLVHRKQQLAPGSGLNGSLNALNINDAGSGDGLFKQPADTSPSLYYTPPPSRSSSLLSLDGQPAQTNSKKQDHSRWPLSHTSSVRGSRKQSTVFGTAVGSHNSLYSVRNKPLLTPAKLSPTSRLSQFTSPYYKQPTTVVGSVRSIWDPQQRYDHDVGIHDSVSQVGATRRSQFEISDDDDVGAQQRRRHRPSTRRTSRPRTTVTVNSTSPSKSMVSSFTSFTSRSVQKVENSRLCKWLLAVCIFFNFVMVVILVLDSRDLRRQELLHQQRRDL